MTEKGVGVQGCDLTDPSSMSGSLWKPSGAPTPSPLPSPAPLSLHKGGRKSARPIFRTPLDSTSLLASRPTKSNLLFLFYFPPSATNSLTLENSSSKSTLRSFNNGLYSSIFIHTYTIYLNFYSWGSTTRTPTNDYKPSMCSFRTVACLRSRRRFIDSPNGWSWNLFLEGGLAYFCESDQRLMEERHVPQKMPSSIFFFLHSSVSWIWITFTL